MQNRFEYWVLLLFSFVANLSGFYRQQTFASILAWLLYRVIGLRKKVVVKNLKMAFPDLNEEEIDELAFKNYKSSVITLLELMCMTKLTREQVREHFEFEDFDSPAIANKDGKQGVIFLTAHFGNWELGAIAAGIRLNSEIAVLYKPQRNNYVSDWVNVRRKKHGNDSIPLGTAVRDIIKSLKAGKFVGLVGDQRGPKEGMRVKFFGHDTAMYPGTAQIAVKLKVPIFLVMTVRRDDGTYFLTTDEIEHLDIEGTEEDKIRAINQQYMEKLEGFIRNNPEQWLWMHNIWKY